MDQITMKGRGREHLGWKFRTIALSLDEVLWIEKAEKIECESDW